MQLIVFLFPLALGGCVVGTVASNAVDIATLPVKVASAGVDAMTTSQQEADENRGKALRKAAERCRKGKPRPEDDCDALSRLAR